jgi:hypothetical protein
VKDTTDAAAITQNFPFLSFFETAPQPLFKFASYAEGIFVLMFVYRHLFFDYSYIWKSPKGASDTSRKYSQNWKSAELSSYSNQEVTDPTTC